VSDTLNPSQRAAVEHDLGPLLVLAGAGSGKTRVVTMRIARLLERGVSARNILAMTFTNKAAAEMHERVAKLVGAKNARELTVSTFHRFGLGVLGAEARALGFRGGKFVIFDQADCSGVVREALRSVRNDKGYDVGAILARISAAKNAFAEPERMKEDLAAAGDVSDYDEITSLVYPRYLSMMKGFQAFDFDDLVCEVVRLFKKRDDVRDKYRQRYRYVIVDEYQDTNHAQLELVRQLGGGHKNVCVVGDDDQSIYAWRGADVRNILDFEEHFSGARVVKLEENYRSSASILAVASQVLEKSGARRHKKNIVSTRPAGDRVTEVVCADPEIEAAFVARSIDDFVTKGEVRRKDCAVLYRSNLQAPDIEQALKERGIPVRMIGGTQFYERKEVKDLLAYLKVAFDPLDEISLRRIINYPARGIGEAALEKLGAYATAYSASLWTAVTRAHAVQDLPPAAREGCRDLVRIVEATRARFNAGELSASVARALSADIRLKEDIQAASTSNAAAARRWGNVEGILGVFGRRDDKGLGTRDAFEDFLRILALREDGEEEEKGDAVTLTTMHGAKGLEFRYVFIVGLEEGLLPHARTQNERATDVPTSEGATSLEEERRLFYVAVTRAKDKLWLMRAERRAFRGKIAQRVPSRFLAEIPSELLDKREERTKPAADPQKTAAGAAGLLAALGGPPPQWKRP
jgi:DNA helicase-2/ATP-dependent DNA helicase PcrA